MTAPDRTTWSMESDPTTGEPVLWHGGRAVLRHSDLRRVTWPEYGDRLFDLLTRVLAPTDEQIRQAAGDMCPNEGGCPGCRNHVETVIEWLATRTDTKPEVPE